MIQQILRLYTAAMTHEVTGLVPHLVGPPGTGKSTAVKQAAHLLGVNLHTINVSRLSPLEVEGVQMPVEGKLDMLLATHWNSLQEGDILLFDEFLRGFPEVYNALLDIFTSREVAGHKLPKVFIIAASNSVAAYDPALSDRLMHLPVQDPRKSPILMQAAQQRIIDKTHLNPRMLDSPELRELMYQRVFPAYRMLDNFTKGNGSAVADAVTGALSERNIIAQINLRQTGDVYIASLLDANNRLAATSKHIQYLKIFWYGSVSMSAGTYGDLVDNLVELIPKVPAELKPDVELNIQLLKANQLMKGAEG